MVSDVGTVTTSNSGTPPDSLLTGRTKLVKRVREQTETIARMYRPEYGHGELQGFEYGLFFMMIRHMLGRAWFVCLEGLQDSS